MDWKSSYKIEDGLIQKVSFAFGEKKIHVQHIHI